MFSIAVTGHRPNKLPCGYAGINHPWCQTVIERMRKFIAAHADKHGSVRIISGMALGIDQLWAIAGLQVQRTDERISVELAIPCINHCDKWPEASQQLRNQIVAETNKVDSNKVTYVSNKPYTNTCMQDRNIYMVDNADLILAFWDGSAGGTANCVHYAQKVGKPVQQVIPKSIVIIQKDLVFTYPNGYKVVTVCEPRDNSVVCEIYDNNNNLVSVSTCSFKELEGYVSVKAS